MKQFRNKWAAPVALLAFGLATLAASAGGAADMTGISVGRTTSASGFHIPSYIAMEQGIFKKYGLDAKYRSMSGKALLNAGIAKQIDFVPIPGGGSQAALKGAPITYLVGQSLISQWTVTAHASIKSVKDLKGKIIGLGRPGSADYDEADIVLSKNFGMEPGRDYKVISFRGEAERIAAMINGDIHAGLLTFPHAAKAKLAGFKVILKTGKYLPRIGGSFWVHNDYLKTNRKAAKAFIHAMAEAAEYMKNNKEGSVDVIQKYFAMKDRREAEGVWEEVFDQYGPDMPEALVLSLFESRVKRMIAKNLWPKDKPLPDVEKFVA
ncbi:MAG: ABC transporter substrate-binding protein, partial [Deltaproteobacteria bacterium]|nr:ABC transporter substrate-binding protein [Deltaproteobacteria bacterium]